MTYVDPLVARRPEFADTQPDLRAPARRTPKQRLVAEAKQNVKPFLLGAAVGASAGFTLAAIILKKQPRPLALFPESKSVLLENLARAALIAVGRRLVRRAFSLAVANAEKAPV
ncbi:MAG TPA: hypothetical protein VHV51_14960 [Polyangiaceae bacterium]|jgi:hypothetical protein|nr:hypothetical protein [Polyangiaceae bacterium]